LTQFPDNEFNATVIDNLACYQVFYPDCFDGLCFFNVSVVIELIST